MNINFYSFWFDQTGDFYEKNVLIVFYEMYFYEKMEENGNADLKDGEEINKNPLKSVEEHNHYKLVSVRSYTKSQLELRYMKTTVTNRCTILEMRS